MTKWYDFSMKQKKSKFWLKGSIFRTYHFLSWGNLHHHRHWFFRKVCEFQVSSDLYSNRCFSYGNGKTWTSNLLICGWKSNGKPNGCVAVLEYKASEFESHQYHDLLKFSKSYCIYFWMYSCLPLLSMTLFACHFVPTRENSKGVASLYLHQFFGPYVCFC